MLVGLSSNYKSSKNWWLPYLIQLSLFVDNYQKAHQQYYTSNWKHLPIGSYQKYQCLPSTFAFLININQPNCVHFYTWLFCESGIVLFLLFNDFYDMCGELEMNNNYIASSKHPLSSSLNNNVVQNTLTEYWSWLASVVKQRLSKNLLSHFLTNNQDHDDSLQDLTMSEMLPSMMTCGSPFSDFIGRGCSFCWVPRKEFYFVIVMAIYYCTVLYLLWFCYKLDPFIFAHCSFSLNSIHN